MKHVQKIALFMAAGMVSAGAQAADFQVAENTTLSVFGEMEVHYRDRDLADNTSKSDFSDEGSLIGFGAARTFSSGVTAFVETEFEYDILGEGNDFDRDVSIFGISGDFGDVQIGDFDNVYIDTIYDVVEPFEGNDVSEEGSSPEDSYLAYFSPSMNGFTFQVQTRVKDETDDLNEDTTTKYKSNELSLIAAAQLDLGAVELRAGYDDRGSVVNAQQESEDPVYGFAGIAPITDNAEIGFRYAMEQGRNSNDDTSYTGFVAGYDYGMGDVYGVVQNVSPDASKDRTEFGVGGDYNFEEGLSAYAEHINYDRSASAGDETDSVTEVGLRYEF